MPGRRVEQCNLRHGNGSVAVGLPGAAEPGNLGHDVHLGRVANRAVSILLEIGLIPAAQWRAPRAASCMSCTAGFCLPVLRLNDHDIKSHGTP